MGLLKSPLPATTCRIGGQLQVTDDMSSENWIIVETMLTLTGSKGESFQIVKLAGGGYGIVYPGRPTGHRCDTLAHCIDIAVKLAGIDLDPR